MSYKKDDDNVIFPTRDGESQGTALERKMLFNVSGPDGVRTKEHITPEGATFRLRTRGGHPEFVLQPSKGKKQCPNYVMEMNHGFVDATYNFMGVGDDTNEPLRNLIYRNGTIPPDKDVFIRNSHAWKESFLLGEQWGTEVDYGGLPSNFSGAMRRLMQVYQGSTNSREKEFYEANQNEECRPPPMKQPFSPMYDKTHGVFFSPSGKRWIIEISSSGIYRIGVDFLQEFSSPNYAVEEVDQDTSAKLWTLTKVKWKDKVLIGAAPSSYALGYSPLYPWCGWAFSSTGYAATHVLFRPHPTLPDWFESALFDVFIGLSGDTPTYGTCTLTEAKGLASPVRDTVDGDVANLQVALGNPGLCFTFPIYAAGASGVNAPIFSFYEGSVKQVYRFVVYDEQTVTGLNTDDTAGNPQTFTANFVGNAADFTELTVTSVLETQDTGIRSEEVTGTIGGGVGCEGDGFPVQNIDMNATGTTVEHELGPSAFLVDHPYGGMTGGLNGVPGVKHTSLRIEIYLHADGTFSTSSTAIRVPDLVGFPLGYVYIIPAQARYTVNGSGHNKNNSHASTIILSGYDRQSISLAYFESRYTDTYTRSGTWLASGRESVVRGLNQYGGPGIPTATYVMAIGSPDTTIVSSTYQESVGLIETHPSNVLGCYDMSQFVGAISTAKGSLRNMDGSLVYVPDFLDTVPAVTNASRTLYTRIGGVTEVSALSTGTLQVAKAGVGVFSFYAGAAAFVFGGTAYFHSKEANAKPTISGISSRTKAVNGLFGFIGAF